MLDDKFNETWDNQDTNAFMALHQEDYKFTFNSDGRVIKKNNFDMGQLKSMMQNIKMENNRCVCENDDILVRHNIFTFASGDREAVMTVTLNKDRLLWRQEAGATSISTG